MHHKHFLNNVKLVIGLGNFGEQYVKTKHNVGFSVIEHFLQSKDNIVLFKKNRDYHLFKYFLDNCFFYILKPLTYMNCSGIVLPSLQKKLNIPMSRVLVVCDNLDLPLGVLKFKREGSSAGQKGLQNIIDITGTKKFPRIFIGIGRPNFLQQSVPQYVLSKFTAAEQQIMLKTYLLAHKAIQLWVEDDLDSIYKEFSLHARTI